VYDGDTRARSRAMMAAAFGPGSGVRRSGAVRIDDRDIGRSGLGLRSRLSRIVLLQCAGGPSAAARKECPEGHEDLKGMKKSLQSLFLKEKTKDLFMLFAPFMRFRTFFSGC
jgi:hypothetical protein